MNGILRKWGFAYMEPNNDGTMMVACSVEEVRLSQIYIRASGMDDASCTRVYGWNLADRAKQHAAQDAYEWHRKHGGNKRSRVPSVEEAASLPKMAEQDALTWHRLHGGRPPSP